MKPPLDARHDPDRAKEWNGPHEGVPPWLSAALVDWALAFLAPRGNVRDGFVERVELRLRHGKLSRDSWSLRDDLSQDPELLLSVVDAILTLETPSPNSRVRAAFLEVQLEEAGSVWRVGTDGEGKRELQRRVSREAIAALEMATSVDDRASQHLTQAWSKAFGRDIDPNAAYDQAVRAVEVVAKPVVSPSNGKATLGTMIADLKNKPPKWMTAFDVEGDVEKVISMVELLWQGMYRHGDDSKPLNHTQEQAEAAVHLAVTLVQWLRSGAVTVQSP